MNHSRLRRARRLSADSGRSHDQEFTAGSPEAVQVDRKRRPWPNLTLIFAISSVLSSPTEVGGISIKLGPAMS
jgi:hypothetical protein